MTDINDIEFGVITATELQDQLINGLVTQITNGNIEVELDGANEEIAIEEGGEEETIDMEVDQTSAIISALNGAINIGNIGTIDDSNIDQALTTLETQLNTALLNMGINDVTTIEMIEDEVLYFYQNKWLTTVANDNDNDLFAMHFDYTQSNNILNVNGRHDGNITGMTWRVRGENKKAYKLEYDNLNRLTGADYIEMDEDNNNQIITSTQGGYDMSASYDLNGNIMTMKRNGAIAVNGSGLATAFGEIDDMAYTYANNSNELLKNSRYKMDGWSNQSAISE
ncbi:MAG: hypothetical protein HC803_07865 [Saprospiraceae bacterium]|nr:hypothetical protein [Saprospiraceae bacterium]